MVIFIVTIISNVKVMVIKIVTLVNSHIKSWRNWKKKLQRTSKIKTFINKYDWKGINYPSRRDNWKKFEDNNPTNALNVLYKYV